MTLEELQKPDLTYLAHYGVIGMKWGVRKDEVGGSTRSKSSDTHQEKRKLTDKQKKYLKIAAISAATVLAVYGGYKLSQSDQFKNLVEIGKAKLANGTDLETGFSKTKKVDIDCINKIDLSKPGTFMNCGNSTIALELRKRGLDVVAKENSLGMYDKHLGQYFNLKPDAIKNLSWDSVSDRNPLKGKMVRDSLEKAVISSFPEGSRGSVLLPLTQGNHFIGWSVKNGKVIFEDAQNPKIDYDSLFSSVTKNSFLGKKYGGAQFVRLDNATINASKIREVVKGRGIFSVVDNAVKDLDFTVRDISGPGFVIKNYTYV